MEKWVFINQLQHSHVFEPTIPTLFERLQKFNKEIDNVRKEMKKLNKNDYSISLCILKTAKKILILLIVLFAGFWIWYEYTYSMDTVIPFEINDPSTNTKVLIASQGSKFKDSLVKGVLKRYEKDMIYFKVIDVYTLFTVNLDKWDALIFINSWEYGSPPRNVKKFIKNHPDQLDKLIILSTVGSSNIVLKDVDVISGESIIEKTSMYTEIMVNRLNQIIKRDNE